MFAYRFKLNFEEHDGFAREIELGVDQTFLDFYNAIADNLSLDRSINTSFFLCDHRYRKKKEIFHPQKEESRNELFEDDTDGKDAMLLMNKCVLNEFIDDPHQKFLLVYDMKNQWSFYIDLMKIVPAQESETYPRFVKSIGGVPDEINRKPRPLPGLVDEEDLDIDAEDDTEESNAIMGGASSLFAEEELDELDDSGFYEEGPENEGGAEDFDETKF